MLNTQKLLYLLPDVAYIAELLPGKKPTQFTVQSFRQINGEFINEDELIGENVQKLIQKLEPEEYHLILPDFLFTNTIISVKEKSDIKIKQYLKEELLPKLDLNADTHQIDTTVLTEHGDSTKIQLSALEKSVLIPIQLAATETKLKITAISPLSWTLKSLISLEPSISVLQAGSYLYIALHYIGVDQASQAKVDEVENIYETIKTLKGGEPSIQTVYLISNELVEEQLKEHLSDTLPIQQLSQQQDQETKMPSYVQKMLETSMRTLSISEYPVPKFELGKAPAGAVIAPVATTEKNEDEDAGIETEQTKTNDNKTLPRPTQLGGLLPAAVPAIAIATEQAVEELDEVHPVMKSEEPPVSPTPPTVSKETNEEEDQIEALLASLHQEDEVVAEPEKVTTDNKHLESKPVAAASVATAQPAAAQPTTAAAISTKPTPPSQPTAPETPKPAAPKPLIKNKNNTKNILKMVFVTLAVFFATVAIGIGIGLGILSLSQKSSSPDTIDSPVVETTPSPTPSPSPSPSPEPEINKADTPILIVNATTKAGYAGEKATLLKKDGFTKVTAGNAKGDYEDGTYVLMTEKNQALITTLEKALGITLQYSEKQSVEDAKSEYQAIIVLAE